MFVNPPISMPRSFARNFWMSSIYAQSSVGLILYNDLNMWFSVRIKFSNFVFAFWYINIWDGLHFMKRKNNTENVVQYSVVMSHTQSCKIKCICYAEHNLSQIYFYIILKVHSEKLHDYLLNRLLRRRSKKASKLRVTGLCVGNSPMTGEFPPHRVSNAEMLPFDDVIIKITTRQDKALVQYW